MFRYLAFSLIAVTLVSLGADFDERMRQAMASGADLAKGKAYTFNIQPNAFPHGYAGQPMCRDEGDAVQLTDGIFATNCWFDRRTVGWWKESEFIYVTIDLQKVESIGTVAVRCSSEKQGFRVPVITKVWVSETGKDYAFIGQLPRQQALRRWMATRGKDINPHGWIYVDKLCGKGRYVTVGLLSSALYLDEIVVLRGERKPEDITNPPGQDTLVTTPFYKLEDAYVAREFLSPICLGTTSSDQHFTMTLTLPEGIELVAPAGERVGPQAFRVQGADLLFLRSVRPAGDVCDLILTGREVGRKQSEQRQVIRLHTISVPAVKPFREVLTSVTFAPYRFWAQWPNLVSNYKATGLNLLMPFSQTDYWYYMHIRQDKRAIGLIQEAKKAGLKVGGNFSPYCNIQINKSGTRKCSYLDEDRRGGVNCPRTYLETAKKKGNGDLIAIARGVENGLEYLWLDSEPYFSGQVCACDVCNREWLAFAARHGWKTKTLREAFVSEPDHVQVFWNEFYGELWGMFKKAAPEAKLALYGSPTLNEGRLFGGKAAFAPLYQAGIVQYAAPEFYLCPTSDYGATLRRLRRNCMPEKAPGVIWMTAGGHRLTFERTHLDLRNRLLQAMTSGFQGFAFWSAYGVDAADYGVISEIIGIFQPYEDIILHGRLLPEINLKAGTANILALKDRALMIVECPSDHSQQLEVPIPPEFTSVRCLCTPDQTFTLVKQSVKVTLGGEAEKDFLRVFLLGR